MMQRKDRPRSGKRKSFVKNMTKKSKKKQKGSHSNASPVLEGARIELNDNTSHLSYASYYADNGENIHSSESIRYSQNPIDSPTGHETGVFSDEAKDADEKEYIIRLLSRRAMHLPNMNWCQDWIQYMKNNHLILGIFFHHELHPLKAAHRLYILLASVSFGLAATNCIYLYYVFHDEEMDKMLIEISLEEMNHLNIHKLETLEVTYGMVALWTFGGALHSVFDICMWYLSACACFLSGASCSNRGRCQVIGSYIVIAVAAVFVALALFIVFMRAAYDRRLRLAEEGIMLQEFEWEELGRIKNFSFLIGYAIELVLVYLAYYPFFITLLFTGILPCIGRPKELEKQNRERKAREKKYRVYDQNGNECV